MNQSKHYFGFTQQEISLMLDAFNKHARVLRYQIAEDNLLLIIHGEIGSQDHVKERMQRNQSTLDTYTDIINRLSAVQVTNTLNDSNSKEKYL